MYNTIVVKYEEVRKELFNLEDLLFEIMDDIWRSRVPPALENGPYLLDPMMVMSAFLPMANFFEANKANKDIQREACLLIIKMPTFLHLIANVLKKQLEGTYTQQLMPCKGIALRRAHNVSCTATVLQ